MQWGSSCYFTHFINLPLLLAQYQSECKLANSIPLFKTDNLQLNAKWITVLFLCMLASFSKICERVVFFHLYHFFMEIGSFFINSSRVLGLVTEQLRAHPRSGKGRTSYLTGFDEARPVWRGPPKTTSVNVWGTFVQTGASWPPSIFFDKKSKKRHLKMVKSIMLYCYKNSANYF